MGFSGTFLSETGTADFTLERPFFCVNSSMHFQMRYPAKILQAKFTLKLLHCLQGKNVKLCYLYILADCSATRAPRFHVKIYILIWLCRNPVYFTIPPSLMTQTTPILACSLHLRNFRPLGLKILIKLTFRLRFYDFKVNFQPCMYCLYVSILLLHYCPQAHQTWHVHPTWLL
jgi:hypothetical protein